MGGGAIMVPALVMAAGISQHQAQGTALLVMPLALIASWQYFKEGNLNLGIAGLVSIGFAAGMWGGSVIAHHLTGLHIDEIHL